jgi:prepilin-type N-terminal cleavage/methylation domain-containing protein
MENYYMRLIQFLLNCANLKHDLAPSKRGTEDGFSLLEVLVASFIGLIVAMMCSNTALVQRQLFSNDSVRTSLNQNLRGAADIIVSDGRVAGENLAAAFPAIEVVSGEELSQELILRRNLLDAILNVCSNIQAGTSRSRIYIANSNTVSGCVRSEEASKYNTWQNYRLAQEGQTAKAYIYNSGTKTGEFFTYSAEGITSQDYWISAGDSGTWSSNYPANTSWIIILEEWRYRKNGEMLQIIENGDITQPFNLAFGIKNFTTKVVLQDGSEQTLFSNENNWTEIKRIETVLSGEERSGKSLINKTINAYFFPRNVLSH